MENDGTESLVFKSSLYTIHVHSGAMCTTLQQYQGEADLLNVTCYLSQ